MADSLKLEELELIPVTDLNVLLLDYWPAIQKHFVEEVLIYSNGDEDIALVMRQLMATNWLMWVWVKKDGHDKDVFGFVTTRMDIINTSPRQQHLIVTSAWCGSGVSPLTLTKATHDKLEEFAASMGCSKLKTYTLRDMGRWMEQHGFSPFLQEYSKDIIVEA